MGRYIFICIDGHCVDIYGYYETDANHNQARFSRRCFFSNGQPLHNHWLSYMEGYLGHNSSSNIHHYTCIINHSSLHYPILYPILFLPYWSFNIHHQTFIILLAQFIINHYTIQYSCLYSFFIINYSTFTIGYLPTCIFFHQPSSILYAKASIMYSIFIQYSTCCNLYVTCNSVLESSMF